MFIIKFVAISWPFGELPDFPIQVQVVDRRITPMNGPTGFGVTDHVGV